MTDEEMTEDKVAALAEVKDIQAPKTTKTPEEVVDDMLDAEQEEWIKLGADPNRLGLKAHKITAEIKTISFFLNELGISNDRLQYVYKEKLVETLKEMREDIEPIILQARREAAGIAVPDKTIIGPNGERLL